MLSSISQCHLSTMEDIYIWPGRQATHGYDELSHVLAWASEYDISLPCKKNDLGTKKEVLFMIVMRFIFCIILNDYIENKFLLHKCAI